MIKQLTLLNETILDCLEEKNEVKIVKNFTEVGIKILDADFGFVWLKDSSYKNWALAYKTKNLPFEPHKPRTDGVNYKVLNNRKIEYIKKFKETPHATDSGKYIKSLMIIPISYREQTYGTLVICFKKRDSFPTQKRILSTFLGNGIAQSINMHRAHEKTLLLEQTKLLLSQEKLKTEFLANATHEFRTPLAIMRGNMYLALNEPRVKNLKPAKKAFKSIADEILHLSSIISDLATLTSKEGQIQNIINFAPTDLIEVLKHSIKRLRVLINKKNVSVKIHTGKIKKLNFNGDKDYLDKLFLNLLRNAITYGKEKGTISIDVKVEKNEVVIKIKDNGMGITKEDLPYIFERFYRGEKARQMTHIGTGLGLAIAKWIVQSHEGTITAESIPDIGSIFTVTVPLSNTQNSSLES